jgi:hypothetical protein
LKLRLLNTPTSSHAPQNTTLAKQKTHQTSEESFSFRKFQNVFSSLAFFFVIITAI